MTMGRAVLFLIASGILMALGIFLLIVRVNGGLIDSGIDSRTAGARIGENAATPEGVDDISQGSAGATVTAAVRTATAIASSARTAVPSPGTNVTPVALGNPVEVGGSRYTVFQVVDPEPPGTFTTTAGNRRVALEVSQEALNANATYSFANFRIRDVNGKDYTWAITNTSPRFDTGSLKAGETRRGWISFQVPAGVALDALLVQPPGQARGTVIVTLR